MLCTMKKNGIFLGFLCAVAVLISLPFAWLKQRHASAVVKDAHRGGVTLYHEEDLQKEKLSNDSSLLPSQSKRRNLFKEGLNRYLSEKLVSLNDSNDDSLAHRLRVTHDYPVLIGIGSVHSASTTVFDGLSILFGMQDAGIEIGMYCQQLLQWSQFIPDRTDAAMIHRVHQMISHSNDSCSICERARTILDEQTNLAMIHDDYYLFGDGNGLCVNVMPLVKNTNVFTFNPQRQSTDNSTNRKLSSLEDNNDETTLIPWFDFPVRSIMNNPRFSLSNYMKQWSHSQYSGFIRQRQLSISNLMNNDLKKWSNYLNRTVPLFYLMNHDLSLSNNDTMRLFTLKTGVYDDWYLNNSNNNNNHKELLFAKWPLIDDFNRHWKITKTTSYYRHPHAAEIFARYHSRILHTRFVWLLRDPIAQTWSVGQHWHRWRWFNNVTQAWEGRMYWDICDKGQSRGICEQNHKKQEMKELIEFRLLLSSMIARAVDSNVISDQMLISLYYNLYYSEITRLPFGNEMLGALYYIPLLIWLQAFEHEGGDPFRQSHFRIIQTEWLVKNLDLAANVIRCFAMTGLDYYSNMYQSNHLKNQACPFVFQSGLDLIDLHINSQHHWSDSMTDEFVQQMKSVFYFPNLLMDQAVMNDSSILIGQWNSWNV